MQPTTNALKPAICFFTFLFFFQSICFGQDSLSKVDKLIAFPDKLFAALDKKSRGIESKLDRQTQKYLARLQKQEEKLKRKLIRRDSAFALSLFGDVEATYTELKKRGGEGGPLSQVYSSRLDSLSTGLRFLKEGTITSVANHPAIDKSLSQYKSLQGKLNASEQIKKQVLQRQQLLKEQFQRLGMVKELKKFRKEVYYYQARVREYKELWEDPSKLEKKLLEALVKLPLFKDFFARNSQLGQLFALPGSNSSGASPASLQGLQTRAFVDQLIADRFGSGSAVTQALQQNVQSAQGQLSALKDKAASLGSGSFGNGEEDMEMPHFTPNSQKTKSFLKRLEWGGNIQSQKAKHFFPVTSDIGISLGYRLNDKSVVGVGGAYKIGWGSGFRNISITHQGVGLRSYMDWQLKKGGLYISGGYELNYRSLISSINQLRGYSAWQRSGLVGLSKKYKVSKKLKGSVQLLWDFLSYEQVPRAQPLLFRVGYSLK